MAVATNALGSGAVTFASTAPDGAVKMATALTGVGQFFGMMMSFAEVSALNGPIRLGTQDGNGNGAFTDAFDTFMFLGGTTSSAPDEPRRWGFQSRANSSNYLLSGGATRDYWTGTDFVVNDATPYLFIMGWAHVGPGNTAADWRAFQAGGPIGGTAVARTVPLNPTFATWLDTTIRTASQLFADQSTSTFRTPSGTSVEHFGYVDGDFPWDSVNDIPDLAVVQDMLDGLATWESASVLNGGTLKVWYPLRDTTDLSNVSPTTLPDATIRGTLVNADPLGTGLWAATGTDNVQINNIPLRRKVIGGRGTASQTYSGTYEGDVTGVQIRYETEAGVALPGLDWTAVDTFGSGVWSDTVTLPFQPDDGYPNIRIRIRATNNTDLTAEGNRLVTVGTAVVLHGQSGVELSMNPSGFSVFNPIGLTVAAGAKAVYVDVTNKKAGTDVTYVRPTERIRDLAAGATPTDIGQGAVAFVNEWHAAGMGPVKIVMQALNGTNMGDWAADAVVDTDGGWTFLGTVSQPGVSGPDGSGLMGFTAWLADGQGDVHLLYWQPGFVPASQTAYLNATEARYTVGDAKWLVIPPGRGSRNAPDRSVTIGLRTEHRDWAVSLGAKGYLGPTWADLVMDGTESLHSAYTATGGVPDANFVGQSRLGAGFGRCSAWVYDPTIKVFGPRTLKAYFQSATRDVIVIETGKTLRTLNSAAIVNVFWVSENSGSTWGQSGFAASIDGTKVILTKGTGVWPETTTRVDALRNHVFGPDTVTGGSEVNAETDLHGILYDDTVWRGNTNLALEAGNPLWGTNGAGLPVALDDGNGARLVTAQRWPDGTYTPTVEMRRRSDDTLLVSKSVSVTVTAV